MTDKPLISVIIPTHNNEKTLGTAIDSILSQTYSNLDIIVVNDNSTDNTHEVALAYTRKDPRVRAFSLPFDDPHRVNKRGRNINAGYMSRNYALQFVKGEWVTFQDGDDASLRNRIEVQYDLAQKYKSSHVCVQWMDFKENHVGKTLDTKKIFDEHQDVIIDSQKIIDIANRSLGPIVPYLGPINEIIPFEMKRARIINKLFFGTLDPYPATGNSPLVKSEVFKYIQFNPLQKRIWPSFAGRGADRDFNFRVATKFKDSLAFNLPLYLWRAGKPNDIFPNYEKYLY